jgi:protein SCO1/2
LLKAYTANFGSDFVALRPSLQELPQVTKDFKIYYKKVAGQTPTSYTMDHSAGSYTFDPQGRIRLYNRHASGAEALAADVKILLSGQ